MPNLAPRRRSEASDLAHRVVGEVVVQKEATLKLAFLQVVDELFVFLRAERRRDQGLGFTTRKQRRAVRARQPSDVADDQSTSWPSSGFPVDLPDTTRPLLFSAHRPRHSWPAFPDWWCRAPRAAA